MSLEISRRQGLKLLAGVPLYSLSPLSKAFTSIATQVQSIILLGNKSSASQSFAQQLDSVLDCTALNLDLRQIETFLPLSDLPGNSILFGLVSEAEKIIVDTLVQNRRGILKTTGNFNKSIHPESRIEMLSIRTVEAALENSQNFESKNSPEGGLSSFYALI
ncbi:MAG: hypothetical protein CMP91_13460 [Gammaproteobacteria bacterium]|nr:hypothetical protein [Gammaproteobacteria bacterium]|tara:strand:+ start:6724 stop:7209 length:486 start_codon:yes stop_codon:yes gene_type:complete